MSKRSKAVISTFGYKLYKQATFNAFKKLAPSSLYKNPVMFVVEIGLIVSTFYWLHSSVYKIIFSEHSHSIKTFFSVVTSFDAQICYWLLFTLLFANFAEALAEGRGKAQADSLRKTRQDTVALVKLPDGTTENRPSSKLKKGDTVIVEAGSIIPGDGTVINGVALVDESAITGESAPVIREAGGDRSAVTGGTKILADSLTIMITQELGKSFLDQMIALVEGATRNKTPNEIALSILLSGLTIIFLLSVATLLPFARYSNDNVSVSILVALLVCLIPTTIGGLLSAIGIAGMDRLVRRNVLALSGRAVEAAGNVDFLILDKTGTITLGNRVAHDFIPVSGVDVGELTLAAYLSSLSDLTPEGRSITGLINSKGIKISTPKNAKFLKFSAETQMSGINFSIDNQKQEDSEELATNELIRKYFHIDTPVNQMVDRGLAVNDTVSGPIVNPINNEKVNEKLNKNSPVDIQIRKGALNAILKWLQKNGGYFSPQINEIAATVSREGGTPLIVANSKRTLGVIYLKDMVKPGISERFKRIRSMGIKTIMVTGDNHLTAEAIARESGVDSFMSEAKPEDKLKLIKDTQEKGCLVAMGGDGTNDAPALAQADVGLVMNTGTQAARESGNMIDLDSDPTKIIEVVEIGKELLITRGALTTFSIANDVAKYFAILPALFAASYPGLQVLNIMKLQTSESAILSTVIFNAIVIILLIPLALKGVRYNPKSARNLLIYNVLIYGVGGLITPFIGIKIIDIIINHLGMV